MSGLRDGEWPLRAVAAALRVAGLGAKIIREAAAYNSGA